MAVLTCDSVSQDRLRVVSSPFSGVFTTDAEPRNSAAAHHENAMTQTTWKTHLESYEDLNILKFASDEEADAALDLLWTDALREVPHDIVDGDTIVVPAEAVDFFRKAGLQFATTIV